MPRLALGVSGVDSGAGQSPVRGIGGQFTMPAASTTTVSDSDILAGSAIAVQATNGPAGLLIQSKSCYISNVLNGSFVFNVSATGAGAPAGTEVFVWMCT